MGKQLIITIPMDSNKPFTFETTGFSGTECMLTSNLEALLGNVISTTHTSEMYDRDSEIITTVKN